MSVEPIHALMRDVQRLLVAGSTSTATDEGLHKRLSLLRPLSERVPALAALVAAVERVTNASTREAGRAFLDLVVMARQLRGSLAGTGTEGALHAIEKSGPWQTPMPARDVYHAHEALTADASSTALKDAVERVVTGDLRLVPSALTALESSKSSIADLVADKVLPAVGRGVLPDLLAKLDLKGTRADGHRLRAICKIDPKTGAELCRKGLSEGSLAVKIQALACLPDVGRPGEAERIGLEMWKEKRKDVRAAALGALRKATGEEALDVLIEALAEDNLQILETAISILAELPHPRATERLLREVKEQTANLPPVPKLKKGAKKEAHKEAEKAEEARQQAILTLHQVIVALGSRRDAQNARVLKTLLALMHHDEGEIRVQAVHALAKLGPDVKEVVRTLIQAIRDADFDVAGAAVSELRELPLEKRERVMPILLEYAADPRANDYILCVIVGMLPQHMNRFADKILKVLHPLLNKKNHLLLGYAINALSEIGPPARKLLPEILEQLKCGEVGTGANYVQIFARLEPEGTTSIPALIQLLRDRKALVREFALEGLTGYGTKAQAAEPFVTKLQKDRDWSVKITAQNALSVIKGQR